MTLRQLKRLLAGETIVLKNGRIYLDGDWFVVEERVEFNFITVGAFENLGSALKRLSDECIGW